MLVTGGDPDGLNRQPRTSGGLEGMSKVVALERGPHGVTSNCINPGYVRTPRVEQQIAEQARAHGIDAGEDVQKVMLTRSAVQRLIEPSRGGRPHRLPLLTPAASITGASLLIGGGWTAK